MHLQTLFLIFIAAVFVITTIFGVLIWKQTIKLEKKALAAKQKKEAYLQQLQQENEERLLIEEQVRLDNSGSEEKVEEDWTFWQKE